MIAVRDARADDAQPLAALVAPQPLLVRYGVTAEGLARDLSSAVAAGDGVLVAEEAGRSRGLAWFQPTGTFGARGYLRLIALAPGGEGSGVGAALLAEVERRVALESSALFLLVSHWNGGARRFYARQGYAEVGLLRAFIRPDTDEIICMKVLP